MIQLILATIQITPDATKALERDLIRLGAARAHFGEIPNSGPYKYVPGTMSSTTILFPCGRGDIRYYVSPSRKPGTNGRITCMRKVHGKLTKEWLIYTCPGPEVKRSLDRGGLENYLLSDGFKLVGKPSSAALDAFSLKGGLAKYRNEPPGSGWYGVYISPMGQEKRDAEDDFVGIDNAAPFKEPWPITKGERQEILERRKPRA